MYDENVEIFKKFKEGRFDLRFLFIDILFLYIKDIVK